MIALYTLAAMLFASCAGETESRTVYSGDLLVPKDSVKVVRSKAEWKKLLPEDVYLVTREQQTERPYTGKYLDHHEEGTYTCFCCGLPLFSSDTKFESGTGWPSFYEALPNSTSNIADRSGGMVRTEVVCKRCDAHLGHVFEDDPEPTGLRYCMNSVALGFTKSK